jgi:hypothetical protein
MVDGTTVAKQKEAHRNFCLDDHYLNKLGQIYPFYQQHLLPRRILRRFLLLYYLIYLDIISKQYIVLI